MTSEVEILRFETIPIGKSHGCGRMSTQWEQSFNQRVRKLLVGTGSKSEVRVAPDIYARFLREGGFDWYGQEPSSSWIDGHRIRKDPALTEGSIALLEIAACPVSADPS